MFVAADRRMVDSNQLAELREIYPEAQPHSEAGIDYVYIPNLVLPIAPVPTLMEALLCPQQHSGYMTRLFLDKSVSGHGNNWTCHNILGRSWYTCSWNGVAATQRLTQILAEHLSCTVLLNMAFSQYLRTFREICHGKGTGDAL